MTKADWTELGRVQMEFKRKALYIKDLKICEKPNEHGSLYVRFVPQEEIAQVDLQGLVDTQCH